jgi:hypothetical protein
MIRKLAVSLWLLCAGLPAFAATPAEEIDHLLGFIAGSSCAFIRNGTDYKGPEAADHIRDKYDYFKDEIKSAEDFIAKAATRSELSGRLYQVRCGDTEPVPAADWLNGELASFRASQP